MSRVLLVLTAANSLTLKDGSSHPTGYWAEEFVESHRGLVTAGVDVTIATPGGRPAPADPASIDPQALGDVAKAADYAQYIDGLDALRHPAVLEDEDVSGYDAIVMPGGHGPMEDLAVDGAFGAKLRAADEAGIIVAPFCHGPAGLLSTEVDGAFAFAGRRLTVFTDAEEDAGLGDRVPWYVADRLRDAGAILESGAPWSSHVVVDGNLVSGQNPQSSVAVTQAVLVALAARSA